MEKNIDGYYSLFTVFDDGYDHQPEDGITIIVENNKAVDCFFENPGKSQNTLENLMKSEDLLQNIIGENFKDIAFDSVANNKFLDIDFYDYRDGEYTVSFVRISDGRFEENLRSAFKSEDEYKAHQEKVADILQSKENKATLGKTGVMDKIADMKNGRSGK